MTAMPADLIGRWFKARQLLGVDDTIHIAVLDRAGQVLVWQGYPHARFDGTGAMSQMLSQWGCRFSAPRPGRDDQPPGFWPLLHKRPWQAQPVSAAPRWKTVFLDQPVRETGPGAIQVQRFSAAQTRAIQDEARRQDVSLACLVLAAQHRVLVRAFCHPGSHASWFVPVDLRASLSLPHPHMNHCSGVFLSLADDASAGDVSRHLRRQLRAGTHWWYWRQARMVAGLGQPAVNRVYRAMSSPGRYMGSFSTLGDWCVDWRDSGFPDDAALLICGPGSPAYPFANGVMITNGVLTLALKPDPVLGISAAQTRDLMQQWVGALMPLQSMQPNVQPVGRMG